MSRILLYIFLTSSLFAGGDAQDTLRFQTEADSLFNIADSLLKIRQLDKAMELYQDAYQKISTRENKAKLLKGMGMVDGYQGNFKDALANFEKELVIHKELGNRSGEANAMNNMGYIYKHLSDYPKALEYCLGSLDICREIGDRLGEMKALVNIGIAYGGFSDYLKVLEYNKKSLEIAREIGERSAEGVMLNNIGLMYSYLSEIPKALEYYEKSLEIKREFGDRQGESTTLGNIGGIYLGLSDYPKALEYYEKALTMSRLIGDRFTEGGFTINMGIIYDRYSNYPKALEYYEKALEIAREIGDRSGEGNALFHLGGIYAKLGTSLDYEGALKGLEYSLGSLDIYREIGYRVGEGNTLLRIGILFSLVFDYYETEKYTKESLVIFKELKREDRMLHAYMILGDCYANQNLESLAVENYAKSIEIAENIRGNLEIEEQKTSYSAGKSKLYAKIVLAHIRQDRNLEAFNYVERSRARSFLDMLASGEVKVGKSSHQEFLENEEKFHEIEEDLEEELIAAEEDTVLYAELRGKMEEQRGLMIREIEEKKEYEPELASLVTVNSLTLPQVQTLLDKETVLEYFLTKYKTLIWLITKDHTEVFEVDVGSDSLKVMVKNFRSAIKNLSDSEEQSSKLYDLLIKPAVNKIETEELVIIPHGILHYLPFQALQDETGNYILEKYQISYLPSASVMKYIIPKKRKKGKTILALGNPKLDNTSYASLPFAEQEVKTIAKQYRKSKVFTGSDATEENFRQLAPDYDILHLACHAEMNSAYPLYSGLLLSSSEKQDGELDVHELFTMDLNASLVVLSACQTGLGHLTNGDELVGLSRAFIYAGTPSIISSLWMVEDESTSYLMEQFYKNLKKYNKAESLQKAQLQTMKKYKNLRSWASFVLVGES